MASTDQQRKLFLCAGLQASGSTLCSWCFLQRPDLDGVLDGRFDMIPEIPPIAPGTTPWFKFTIVSFRLTHMVEHFREMGYDVTPLLVVRDVRSVFNSLLDKPRIACNGTTAEEPPLRFCLRRFREDWEYFQKHGWPVLRYESFLADPDAELRQLCRQMNLPWDSSMIDWPKPIEQIADARWGSRTLRATRGQGGLQQTLITNKSEIKTDRILPADMRWLEDKFVAFNTAMNYPLHVPYEPPAGASAEAWLVPSFKRTSRYRRQVKHQLPHRRALRATARFFSSLVKPLRIVKTHSN